jgi:hypothetical protein
MAQINPPGFAATTPIETAGVRRAAKTGAYSDEDALRLVVQTADWNERGSTYKDWANGWSQSLRLYQSQTTAQPWNSGQPRNNFPFFTLANTVKTFVPQVIDGMFEDDPPFLMKNLPGTKFETARAVGAVLNYQINEEIGIRKQISDFVRILGLFGTGIVKWGWDEHEEKRWRYKKRNTTAVVSNGVKDIAFENQEDPGGLDEEEYDYLVSQPTFENITNLKHVLVDNTLDCSDIRKAKFVIHRIYLTWEEIEELRDQTGYDLPSKDEVISWFLPPDPESVEEAPQEIYPSASALDKLADPRWLKASADMLSQPLEILEYWTNDRTISVLQKKKTIRNIPNPFGVIPFLSCNFLDVPGAFWGMGLGQMVGPEQRLQQGIINIWLDQVTLALFGAYIREKGSNSTTQNIVIGPGTVVDVDNIEKFKNMERPPSIPEAGVHIQLSQGRVEQVAGSSLATSGIAGPSGHSNAVRTAAGVGLLASGAQTGVAYLLDNIANQVFIPFLNELINLNRLMPEKVWRRILNSEPLVPASKPGEPSTPYQKPQEDPEFDDLVNAELKFRISAGSKMKQKLAMAQSLPIIMQTLLQDVVTKDLAIQGKKIDFVKLMKMWFIVSGWPNEDSIIVDMTPEDQQRLQAQSPIAQIQAKGQLQRQQQDHQAELKGKQIDHEQSALMARDITKQHLHAELDPNQQNLQRGVNEVQRRDLELEAGPESLTGQPAVGGFGTGGGAF